MDLSLTEEQLMIQTMAKRFAENELATIASKLDLSPDDEHYQEQFLIHLRQLAELGFIGLNVKSEYGGANAGTIAFSLAITELAKVCASTAVTVSVTNMVAELIQSVGSEQQKQQYLPKLCSGEYRAGAFCLTESGAGSDASAIKTTAQLEGDYYILNGAKLYITSASFADLFIVWAVTNNKAKKGQGISCFLIPKGIEGMSIGKAEAKMGQKASPIHEVFFNQCRVNKSALLGQQDKGFAIAVNELAGGRIGIGSLALGVGLAAMDYASQHVLQRYQFEQPLAKLQAIQWQIAESYTDLEAARLLLMQAADNKAKGLDFAESAAMAKLFASEKANLACNRAMQMLGGLGYTQACPIERMVRDVRVTTIYEGTSEIQKLIIARGILSRFS